MTEAETIRQEVIEKQRELNELLQKYEAARPPLSHTEPLPDPFGQQVVAPFESADPEPFLNALLVQDPPPSTPTSVAESVSEVNTPTWGRVVYR